MRADTIVDTNGDTIFPIAGGLPDGAVTTAKIQDDAVTTVKLASGAVETSQLINGSIGNDIIADGAVTTAKLADGAVIWSKLANSSVTTDKFANSAVTYGKVADSQITPAKMALDVSNFSLKFIYSGTTATVSAKLISLGTKLWMLTYNGGTGITTSGTGAKQIDVRYDGLFSSILMGQCKYSKRTIPMSRTRYASFGVDHADTYADTGAATSSEWLAEILIIGTRTV